MINKSVKEQHGQIIYISGCLSFLFGILRVWVCVGVCEHVEGAMDTFLVLINEKDNKNALNECQKSSSSSPSSSWVKGDPAARRKREEEGKTKKKGKKSKRREKPRSLFSPGSVFNPSLLFLFSFSPSLSLYLSLSLSFFLSLDFHLEGNCVNDSCVILFWFDDNRVLGVSVKCDA